MPIQAITPTTATTTQSTASRRAGTLDGLRAAPRSSSSSASSRTSRAALAPDAGHHDVARAGGEHVGDVEAARAAQHRRHALLEQQALDELGLGLVAGAGDAHEVALAVLRLDLACARVRVADGVLLAALGVGQRHPARVAEARSAGWVVAQPGQTSGPRGSSAMLDRDLGHAAVVDAKGADSGRRCATGRRSATPRRASRRRS